MRFQYVKSLNIKKNGKRRGPINFNQKVPSNTKIPSMLHLKGRNLLRMRKQKKLRVHIKSDKNGGQAQKKKLLQKLNRLGNIKKCRSIEQKKKRQFVQLKKN